MMPSYIELDLFPAICRCSSESLSKEEILGKLRKLVTSSDFFFSKLKYQGCKPVCQGSRTVRETYSYEDVVIAFSYRADRVGTGSGPLGPRLREDLQKVV